MTTTSITLPESFQRRTVLAASQSGGATISAAEHTLSLLLALARQIVHGKIRNHRTMIMRNHLEPPESTVLKLKRASEDALSAGSLEELLGIEGAAASQYFQQFSGMIKVEDDLAVPTEQAKTKDTRQADFNFNFNNRNRRPPTDPVNAMLSLAYSLLTKDCTLAALAVGFDPYIGFYHQPRFGRPALGLDLVEEFRPLIAESTVLSCINNRVVTEKDFVRAGQAVNLSAPGRKRFFQIYEQRMSSLITHPLFDDDFPPIPAYSGTPWFLPLVGAYYQVKDWLQ